MGVAARSAEGDPRRETLTSGRGIQRNLLKGPPTGPERSKVERGALPSPAPGGKLSRTNREPTMTNLSDIKPLVYKPMNKVRFVTAASLVDGHDASINIMRRILQASGCEVIHLGHNRSVREIVNCALQEDAHGIAISSYQGGHVEFFEYMIDLLRERSGSHIKVFGGGGGVHVT